MSRELLTPAANETSVDCISITINDKLFQFQQGCSLLTAAESFGAQAPYALMLNQRFVAKSEHDQLLLEDGDRIEVIGAIQGG